MKSLFTLRSFFIGAIVVVLISGVIRLITPPNNAPIGDFIDTGNPFTSTKTEFLNISFTQDPVGIAPEKFQVYTTQLTNQFDTYINALSKKYALKPHPNADTVLIGKEHGLVINREQNTATITRTVQITEYTPKTIDEAKIIELASTEINSLFESLTLKPDLNAIQYFEFEDELESPTKKEIAQIMRIPFSYAFTTYPVYFEKESSAPVYVTATNDFIMKIEVQFVGATVTATTELPSLSQEEAQNNIKNNNATLISAVTNDVLELNLDQISNATLSFSQFEYRYIAQTSTFVPFYAFTGSAQDKNGEPISIKVITPAVPTN